MTNAQKVTFHAVKEIIHAMPLRVSEPEPLHDKEYASVVFELQRSLDTPMKFLIEADGCLARIYA